MTLTVTRVGYGGGDPSQVETGLLQMNPNGDAA